MKDITAITRYGANSFTKARRERPRIRRRCAQGHLAFTVTTIRARYIVRLSVESGKALGECVRADSGAPCKGFTRAGHCFHVGRALLFVNKEASHATN